MPWQSDRSVKPDWLCDYWDDFSRGEPGIICTIWDISRLLWLARPEYLQDEDLKQRIIALRRTAKVWDTFR